MNRPETSAQQILLDQHQIEAFYVDCFANHQVAHFRQLTQDLALPADGVVVDVGGGVGYFAQELHRQTGLPVRVIDSDQKSVDLCNGRGVLGLDAIRGDALAPQASGDESTICFNLILHHLVGANERGTTALQKRALTAWQTEYVFVDEYIYDSYIADLSGRLIYEITSSKILSKVATGISRFVPALRANTFGVGVRFRSHKEWSRLFDSWGDYRWCSIVESIATRLRRPSMHGYRFAPRLTA